MEVVGVRVELPSNQPIVLLREADGQRHLPIWIGGTEATAMEGVTPPRPLTHDLMTEVIQALGASATRVVITKIHESVFYADLALEIDGHEVHVSSRPSDAIALAVRTKTPVFALEEVLEDSGIVFEEDGDPDEEVERFKQFLEDVTVEDFLDTDPGSG
jgi:hypothetical protein